MILVSGSQTVTRDFLALLLNSINHIGSKCDPSCWSLAKAEFQS